jgi:exopolyphosphatase/guanosine-5'-triphosphate,3'-diphosphate pyrophosphatase
VLGEDDQRVVRVLAGLLRVAVGLDRTRDGVVRDVDVQVDHDGVRLGVRAEGDAQLELYSAESRKDLLENALGVPVTLDLLAS